MLYMKKVNYFIIAMVSVVLLCIATPSQAKKLEIIIGGENFCNTDKDCKGNSFCHTGSHICIECQTPPFVWNGTTCA